MTDFQKNVVLLIRKALGYESGLSPAVDDFDEIYRFAESQQMLTLFYYGLDGTDGFDSYPNYLAYTNRVCNEAIYSEKQIFEIETVCDALTDNQIIHCPLKGILLKKMYPTSEMRTMGDGDILIDTSCYDKIRKIMLSLGWEEGIESNHEFVWEKENVHIELHKFLIPSYNDDFFAYYGDGLQFVHNNTMSIEDHFVYIFCHFAKHYRDSGAGIRHAVDLWVYKQTYPQMDMSYVYDQLKQLRLNTFYDHVKELLSVWFCDAPDTEMTDFLTNRLFNTGVYGDHEKSLLSTGIKKSGSNKGSGLRFALGLFFLPYSVMKEKYPILCKLPFLLPFLWFWRALTALLFRRNHIRSNINNVKVLSDEKVSAFRKELDYVGLDYGEDDKR